MLCMLSCYCLFSNPAIVLSGWEILLGLAFRGRRISGVFFFGFFFGADLVALFFLRFVFFGQVLRRWVLPNSFQAICWAAVNSRQAEAQPERAERACR